MIDLDHCIGAHGQVQSEVSKILLYFQSYTEVSPSGTGFHIWVRGRIPCAIKRKEFEIYSTLRYMTVTENPTFNCPLANCQLHLNKIYDKYGKPSLTTKEEFAEPIECKDDLRNLYKVSQQFKKIWHLQCGFDKADGTPDYSSYDMALAGLLQSWSTGRIVWAIQFFRNQWGAKPKHGGGILSTISRAKNNS